MAHWLAMRSSSRNVVVIALALVGLVAGVLLAVYRAAEPAPMDLVEAGQPEPRGLTTGPGEP